MITAKQVKEENGFDIGKFQLAHYEKTEELYLYPVEMNKRIEVLEKENEILKKEIISKKLK